MSKHIRPAIITAALVLILAMGVLLPAAVWDESTAVHVDPAGTEDSTLIIGTHLIYLGALTDTLHETAQASAEASGQNNIYYKSELANGAWFDITSASTLADITSDGIPVTNSVISALFLTHHTKSDGITYDLRTNRPVSIFDIYSPYDLESMEELFPLKTQYDTNRELQGESASGKIYIDRVAAFFMTNVRTDSTNDLDASLGALQTYYNVLAANDGGAAEKEAVLGVMDALDAARRAEVFGIVDAALESLAVDLQRVVDTPPDEEDEDDEGEKGSSADPNLQASVSDSMSNVTDSMNTHSAKMLDRGVTVMSETRHDACVRLIDNAKANNHAACDDDVATIIGLDNIQGGNVVNAGGESALLDGSLLPAATRKYTGALSAGDSAEYKAAVAQNAAAVLKNGIMKKTRNQLTIYRSELEFFIEAASLRLGGDAGLDFIDGRLAQARDYSIDVPRDDSASVADESAEAHIDFLTRLRRSAELGLGGNATDKLLAEKGELQTELLSALDDNDLAGAQDIRNRISALDEELAYLPGGTGAAAAEAALDLVSSVKQDMEAGAGAGDASARVDALSGLLSSNFAAVFPMLEDLRAAMAQKRDLDGDASYNDAIGAIETLISENRDAYNRATAAGLSAAEALAIADAYFNGETDGVRLFDDGLLGGGAASVGTGGSGVGSGYGAAGVGSGGTETGGGSGGTDVAGSGAGDALRPSDGTDATSDAGISDAGGTGTGTGSSDAADGAGAGGTGTGAGTGSSDAADGAGAGRTGTGAGTGSSDAADGAGAGGTGTGTGTGRPGADLPANLAGNVTSYADNVADGDADPSGLSEDEKKAVLISALGQYAAELGDESLNGLMRAEANKLLGAGSPLVFESLRESNVEYLPARAAAEKLRMRYVWNKNLNGGALARGGSYRFYTVYSAEILLGRGNADLEYMNYPAAYKNELYLPSDHTYEAFGIWCESIPGTTLSLLVSQKTESCAAELLGMLLGAAAQ
jgi:hypothetical protein